MSFVIWVLLRSPHSGCLSRRLLLLENLALRHQLVVLRRQTRQPELRQADRLLWLTLRRLWPVWHKGLLLFQPQTVIGWHRLEFRLFWRWRSRCSWQQPHSPTNQVISSDSPPSDYTVPSSPTLFNAACGAIRHPQALLSRNGTQSSFNFPSPWASRNSCGTSTPSAREVRASGNNGLGWVMSPTRLQRDVVLPGGLYAESSSRVCSVLAFHTGRPWARLAQCGASLASVKLETAELAQR
jgi:hypothetical protein